MPKINTGGPAFPRSGYLPSMEQCEYHGYPVSQLATTHGDEGMTLRDWFAGMILSGLTGHPNAFAAASIANRQYQANLSRCVYAMADALLVARELPPDDLIPRHQPMPDAS